MQLSNHSLHHVSHILFSIKISKLGNKKYQGMDYFHTVPLKIHPFLSEESLGFI